MLANPLTSILAAAAIFALTFYNPQVLDID